MDISNCSNTGFNFAKNNAKETEPLQKNGTDGLFETDWCNNAADAIGKAFDNMDDFLAGFKESQKLM